MVKHTLKIFDSTLLYSLTLIKTPERRQFSGSSRVSRQLKTSALESEKIEFVLS